MRPLIIALLMLPFVGWSQAPGYLGKRHNLQAHVCGQLGMNGIGRLPLQLGYTFTSGDRLAMGITLSSWNLSITKGAYSRDHLRITGYDNSYYGYFFWDGDRIPIRKTMAMGSFHFFPLGLAPLRRYIILQAGLLSTSIPGKTISGDFVPDNPVPVSTVPVNFDANPIHVAAFGLGIGVNRMVADRVTISLEAVAHYWTSPNYNKFQGTLEKEIMLRIHELRNTDFDEIGAFRINIGLVFML